MKAKMFFWLIFSLLLAGGNTLVYAQENNPADASGVELEPITVTVSRGAKKISETPASVSIISNRDIAQSDAKNISDLLKNIEGVYTYDSSGVGTVGTINMRGFYGGMSSHQLVLVDGIPQNKGKDKLVDWDLISLDNIDSIEVVRGPASAMYGDNAMSGVINIITKKPAKKLEAKVSSSYGSFNTQEHEVLASGTYKQLGYVFNASHVATEGFRRHCDYDRDHFGGKFDYAVNDDQELRFLLDSYEKKRGALPWAITEGQIAQDRRQARPGTENDSSNEVKNEAGITHSWNVNNLLKTETTFYYNHNDADAFYTSGSTESTKKEQLDNEDTYGILLKGNFNPEIIGLVHKFTAGVDLERDNFDYEEYKAPYQVRGALQSDYEVIRDKVGPYLNDEIALTDFLRINGGLRYDRIHFDFDDLRVLANSKTTKLSKVAPSCGVVYTYRNDSSFYVNYAEAFRAPTTGQMFTYGSSANPDL
ncbi:TonB-dependent receptor, partial [bacterium]